MLLDKHPDRPAATLEADRTWKLWHGPRMTVPMVRFEGTPEEVADQVQALRDLCPLGADRYSGGPHDLVSTYTLGYQGEPTPETVRVGIWLYVHSEDAHPNPQTQRPTVRESVLGAIGEEARKFGEAQRSVKGTEDPPTRSHPNPTPTTPRIHHEAQTNHGPIPPNEPTRSLSSH